MTDQFMERLIRLEERQQAHIETTKQNFDEVMARLETYNQSILTLTDSLNRFKGFWGALSLVASAVAAAYFLVKDWLIDHIAFK